MDKITEIYSFIFLPNWLGSMILMIVVATDSVAIEPSKQFTTAPSRPLVTGLTVILDIRGKLSLPESLETVKMALLISTDRIPPLGPMDVMTVTVVVIA
jgi:hypothetical protein